MKCIQCQTDNKLKDRTENQGRCKNCNRPFAFEPTSMKEVKFTDGFFAKAIADISVNNTLFFSPKQFLYLLDRRLKRKAFSWFIVIFLYLFFSVLISVFISRSLRISLGNISFPLMLIAFNLFCIYYLFNLSNSQKSSYRSRQSSATALSILGVVILVIGVVYSLSTHSVIGYCLTLLIGLSALWLGLEQKRRVAKIDESFLISDIQIQGWLDIWTRINGTVAQLLPQPQVALQSGTPIQNPDITAYSFDSVVVCNTAQIAQMLISNNFHFENNCAILSITGYPPTIFDTVLQMLQRNPELKVYAFHDASPEGVRLIYQLRTSANWFQNHGTIIDLGLLPRHVLASPRHLFVCRTAESATAAQQLVPEIRNSLTAPELAWLDQGNFVELESFTPQQLIRILNRSIANSQQLDIGESGIVIWADDSGSTIYGVESFG